MELRPGYKQTAIGFIPEDWETPTVFDIADRQKARFDDGDWVEAEHITDKGIRLIQTGNIGVGAYVEKDAKKYIHPDSFELLKCKSLEVGDLLICRLAEPAGRACILPSIGEEDVITSVDVTIFRPDPTRFDRGYLVQYFSTSAWFESILENVGGTTHKRISRSSLGGIRVPIPSNKKEQSAIAAALSDVDALLAAQDALIEKKRAIKQGAMQELLTGKRRLPGFAENWEVRRLGDHLKFLRNGTNCRAELSTTGIVKYLHYGDIHVSSDVSWDIASRDMPYIPLSKVGKLARLEVGDLVFADASEDLLGVGKSVEISGADRQHAVPGLHTIAVRFDKSVLADGFKAYLQFMPAFRSHLLCLAAGTKVYSTNRSHISGCEIALPDVREQAAIASTLSDMGADIAVLELKRKKTVQLKQGMMQELLTGRIRLI